MNMPWIVFLILLALYLHIATVQALNRTIGPPNDYRFINVSHYCPSKDPAYFEFGKCSELIACVYDNLQESFKASLGSGTGIAALIPTIQALIGAQPFELVELALMSPHRALAASCFGIGLPTSLFHQLRPLNTQISDENAIEDSVREWRVPLPTPCEHTWQTLSRRLIVDFMILGLAALMLWRLVIVNNFTMVPWRCEYTYLIIAWPIASVVWLAISVGLLVFTGASVKIYNTKYPFKEYTTWQAFALPYVPTNMSALTTDSIPEPTTVVSGPTAEQDNSATYISHNETFRHYGEYCLTIRITMPSKSGIVSWRSYDVITDVLAVGVYLYATFVLTSTLFLNADQAMYLAITMSLGQSLIRILGALC